MPGGGGVSAGDVLKSTRTNITQGNVTIPTNNTSWVNIWSHQHTPSDASSYLHISVAAVVKALSGCSGEFQLGIEAPSVFLSFRCFFSAGFEVLCIPLFLSLLFLMFSRPTSISFAFRRFALFPRDFHCRF